MRQKFSWKLYVRLSAPSAEIEWSFKDTPFVSCIVFKQNTNKYVTLVSHQNKTFHYYFHNKRQKTKTKPPINPKVQNCKNTDAQNELHEAFRLFRFNSVHSGLVSVRLRRAKDSTWRENWKCRRFSDFPTAAPFPFDWASAKRSKTRAGKMNRFSGTRLIKPEKFESGNIFLFAYCVHVCKEDGDGVAFRTTRFSHNKQYKRVCNLKHH